MRCRVKDWFKSKKPLIGMVHLGALPGTPRYGGSVSALYEAALLDAERLTAGGVDGVIVENFGDIPYVGARVEPEQFALHAAIAREVKNATGLPVGINVQFNDYVAELAIALAVEAQFVRLEVFVDTVVGIHGILTPVAPDVMRLKHKLGLEELQVFADLQVKHTRPLLSTDLAESAREAVAAGADAVIVTGTGTGKETDTAAVRLVKDAVSAPVLVGSGFSPANARQTLEVADGAIVGSFVKEGGDVFAPVDVSRVQELVTAARG